MLPCMQQAWHHRHNVLAIAVQVDLHAVSREKRRERAIVSYLTPEETDALIAAPDRETWHGRRDHALLTLTAQTGLRVAELTALTASDLQLGVGAHVYCRGKGRKDRCTPLTAHTVSILTSWLTAPARRCKSSTSPRTPCDTPRR